jgi:hypothetical protein
MAKHRYTAQFLSRFITRDSKRTYSHAWLVEFTRHNGEADFVCGFAGSQALAQAAANAWVPRLTCGPRPFTINSIEIAETTIGRNIKR